MSEARWKITKTTPQGIVYNYSLGYPSKKSALAGAVRLRTTSPGNFGVDKMTPRDVELMLDTLEGG